MFSIKKNLTLIHFTKNTELHSDLFIKEVIIDQNVIVKTNSFNFYAEENFINNGTIITGKSPYIDFPNSFGGSGGGASSSEVYAANGKGFSTREPGGEGDNFGKAGNGITPKPPNKISKEIIQNWYNNGIGQYLAGASGQSVNDIILGGSGGYGIYIQAEKVVTGKIITNGDVGKGTCSGIGLSGGGGAGTIFISYGSGGLTPGQYEISGGSGAPSCDAKAVSGSGGDGLVLIFKFINNSPTIEYF